MSDEKEKVEEEEVEEKAVSELPTIDAAEIVLEDAQKEVEETIDEDITVLQQISSVKSEIAKELRNFLEECDELEKIIRTYVGVDVYEKFMSHEITVKDAMDLIMRMMMNTEEEEIEPSPYVKELIRKVTSKLADCRAFRESLKPKTNFLKPAKPSEPKYVPVPEELLKAEGKKI